MIELSLAFDNTVSQTKHMISHVHKNRQGQATLLIVTVVCVVGIILLMTSLDSFVRDYNYKAKDFNQVLLDETTSSTFAIMETALERRLWEPPPDENCLRSENISVSGTFPDDVKWKVSAFFNAKTRNYEMKAEGENTSKKLKSVFRKKIKVMDLSDYLVLSMNSSEVHLSRVTSNTAPSAMIARDRRIYTKGPLILGAGLERSNPHMNFNGSPANFPAEWGTILQGDRMQFAGGISYDRVPVATPNNSPTTNIDDMLSPYGTPYLSPSPTYFGQAGAGLAVITKDYDKAMKLKEQVSTGVVTVPRTSLKNEVYPIALFKTGTFPLKAWTATDNGTYLNDPDLYSVFYYHAGGANNVQLHMDGTCLSKSDYATTKKYCSNSDHFPRGFSQWRRDAGLEGHLFTADAVEIPSPTLSWENMQALEKDAEQCGAVVSTPVNPEVDCPIWDHNFLMSYRTGNVSKCQNVSRINLDTLTFNHLNAAALNDPANEGRMLRRVVYLKGPAQIIQDKPEGLMTGIITNNNSRKNLSIWIVSEDMMALKGFQKDQTSPLHERPETLREVVFNDDVSGVPPASKKSPLSLILLSPEKVHLLSPFYHPMSVSHLQTIWPTSGGMIRPIRHNLTDWERQEDDGFKYGTRRYRIEGVSLISNAASSAGEPFFLRGLWAGRDSTMTQFTSNQCMSSLDTAHLLEVVPGKNYKETAKLPAYAGVGNSPLPPSHSLFWNNKTQFPDFYVPEVFNVQYNAAASPEGRLQSEVILSGISMATNFSSETPSGKRPLNSPRYEERDTRSDNQPFDLAHKNFGWSVDQYYKAKPIGTACSMSNAEWVEPINGWTVDAMAVQPSVNNGAQTFIQASPDVDYRNVGSVLGVDQLLIETKEGVE